MESLHSLTYRRAARLIAVEYQDGKDGKCIREKHGIHDYQKPVMPSSVFKNQSDSRCYYDQVAG
jgi:hypothetical protein